MNKHNRVHSNDNLFEIIRLWHVLIIYETDDP